MLSVMLPLLPQPQELCPKKKPIRSQASQGSGVGTAVGEGAASFGEDSSQGCLCPLWAPHSVPNDSHYSLKHQVQALLSKSFNPSKNPGRLFMG